MPLLYIVRWRVAARRGFLWESCLTRKDSHNSQLSRLAAQSPEQVVAVAAVVGVELWQVLASNRRR